MGGKDLDLHVLYVEVTKRGGQQQVLFFQSRQFATRIFLLFCNFWTDSVFFEVSSIF